MIRDAIIHLTGKLPLLADLRTLPGARDVSVLATNVRTRDGKRPSFVESSDSWFVLPLREVSLIELPSSALEQWEGDSSAGAGDYLERRSASPLGEHEPRSDSAALAPDAELLARLRDL